MVQTYHKQRTTDNSKRMGLPFLLLVVGRGLSVIFGHLQIRLSLLDGKQLGRVGGDYLVFGVGGDDLDGDVLEADEEQPFPDIGFKQEVFFFIGQVEYPLQFFYHRRRLFKQYLHGRVRENR